MERLVLSARYREVLAAIISDYISDAEPVGSKAVSNRLSYSLSSATIRQVMSELMHMGLLKQPHTSAGRLPTTEGLKYFVENLLEVNELDINEQENIKKRYHLMGDEDLSLPAILQRTSKFLSAISHYAGLVVAPSGQEVIIKHMEFIPLGSRRVLGIFVTRQGQVYNRLLEVDEDYTYPQLEKLSNFCNQSFSGSSLAEAKIKVTKELESKEIEYDRLLKKALLYSELVFSEVPDTDVLVNGETNLLSVPEFQEGEKLRDLMNILDEKRRIVHLLERSEMGQGVRVFIGSETNDTHGSDYGLISANYNGKGRVLGTIGVIGPARMDYGRVIPLVNFTARLISDIITKGIGSIGGNK